MRSPHARSRRRTSRDGTQWLSFSDLMSSLLLIFILIMFYIMYQYFDMYEVNMAKIARQQYDLDQANASLESERTKLSAAESQMLAQQIKLNAAQKDLDDAESILAAQQQELAEAQSLLDDKEDEIAAQQETLDALSVQLGNQQTQIDRQQARLTAQEATLATQQATLEDQQRQIEQLVGMRPRIISSISSALRAASINAQVDPASGAIALESDVLFSTGEFELSERGKAFIDRFLPVYLNALFDEEYLPYVSEVIIEGHTDSQGDYITNLELSQRRALAVATYAMSDGYAMISPVQRARLRKVATANGRSFSDPVLNPDGSENMDASRRVVFKFRLTDEQMIQQMKSILESEDPGEPAAGAPEDTPPEAENAPAADGFWSAADPAGEAPAGEGAEQ